MCHGNALGTVDMVHVFAADFYLEIECGCDVLVAPLHRQPLIGANASRDQVERPSGTNNHLALKRAPIA